MAPALCLPAGRDGICLLLQSVLGCGRSISTAIKDGKASARMFFVETE